MDRKTNQVSMGTEAAVIEWLLIDELKEEIDKISPSVLPVLISGPFGTPKDDLARLIHEQSPLAGRPFVPFAPSDAAGSIPSMDRGGSLYIKDLDRMPESTQYRLLELIGKAGAEEKMRILASVSGSWQGTSQGAVMDLIYSLSTHTIELKPLYERNAAISSAAGFILSGRNAAAGMKKTAEPIPISKQAEEALFAYPWPGNEREFVSTLLGLKGINGKGTLELSDLPAHIREQRPGNKESLPSLAHEYDDNLTYQQNLEKIEKMFLEEQLARFGSKKETAEHFGISKQALNYKLNKLGLK